MQGREESGNQATLKKPVSGGKREKRKPRRKRKSGPEKLPNFSLKQKVTTK